MHLIEIGDLGYMYYSAVYLSLHKLASQIKSVRYDVLTDSNHIVSYERSTTTYSLAVSAIPSQAEI